MIGSKEMGLKDCISLQAEFLGMGTMLQRFQAAGRQLHLIDRLNIEATESESSEANVLRVHAAIPSGPVAECVFV